MVLDAFKMIDDINKRSFWFGLWGAALNIPQVVGGLIFVTRLEAVLILIACVGSVLVAAQMHKRDPFTRLTSWVHLPWIPLLPYLAHALLAEGVETPFGAWLAYVVAVIAISLVLDVRNLWLFYFTDKARFEGAER